MSKAFPVTRRTALGQITALLAAASAPRASATGFTGAVTIVHINDVHGHLVEADRQIGYARMGGFFDRMRAENPNTLVLDAGDVLSGNAYAALDRGLGFAPVLNTLGIDAMTAGNADFVYGSATLRDFAGRLAYPLLCGNMVAADSGTPVTPGLALVALPNGMTVGIVGVTTPVSAEVGATDLEYRDAAEVAQALVDAARAQGADIVIGLLHLGELDARMNSLMITERVRGLDVIVDGHSHTAYPEGRLSNGLLITQTGQFGEAVGVIDLAFTDGRLTGATARLEDGAALAGVPEKAETVAALAPFLARAEAVFAEPCGQTAVLLDGRREAVRTGETNLGNMFTDAMRARTGADLALLEAGYIGGQVAPGEINRRALLSMARVEAEVVVVEVTGAQIAGFLNSASALFPKPSGALLQISGGSYRIAPGSAAPATDVRVGGAPLRPEGRYTVAMVVGSLRLIGSDPGRIRSRAGRTAEILEAHLAANSPVAPTTEGRIVIPQVE